jgi:hypothetical protein
MYIIVVSNNVNIITLPRTKIYPNPADGIITIESDRAGFYEIEITYINGKTQYNERMEGASH